jgi:hypothetical protein
VQRAVLDVDRRALDSVRKAWDRITPAPDCPTPGEVLGEIRLACEHAMSERRALTKQIIQESVFPVQSNITPEVVKTTMSLLAPTFATSEYVALIETTPQVFFDRNKNPVDYDDSAFSLQIEHISTYLANTSREDTAGIQLTLDQILLFNRINKVPLWKRILSAAWRVFAKPTLGGVFKILAPVVTTAILVYLGLKSGG